jgi:hypothetical protein
MEFNAFSLRLVIDNLFAAGIKYQMGYKVEKLTTTEPNGIKPKLLDCSGFIQYVIYKSTFHNTWIPAGTMNQEGWLVAHGYTRQSGAAHYATEAAKKDGGVRIAFRKTIITKKAASEGSEGGSERTGVGHVWLVIDGKTYECTTKKSRNGPTSFDWSVRTDDADSLYFLGFAPVFSASF